MRRAAWRAELGSLDQEAMQPEIGPEGPWRGAGSPRERWARSDVERSGGQAESRVQRVWQRVAQGRWVDRWLSCRSLRRGVGQEAGKDPEPAVTDIQSACALSHDPPGSLLGTQEPFYFCPWPSTVLGPHWLLDLTSEPECTLLTSGHSVGDRGWPAHRTQAGILGAPMY